MTFLCRTLGHKPDRDTVLRDPSTFALHARCKRCGMPISAAQPGWKEQALARP